MVVRHGNSRRRRMVTETSVAPSNTPETNPQKASSETSNSITKRAYAYGANRDNQLRTTDLIPKQFWACLTVITLLFLAYAGVVALSWFSPRLETHLSATGIQALAISGPGSLGTWLVSTLLLLTCLASLQLYALRRHRADDYTGTYRVWLWMASFLLIGSLVTSCDLASVFKNFRLTENQVN